ncbi:assimilatory sulfite reductase (NADPH) flavoprotein subunit [Glaciecola petra]|uniref:Sulfite reductase [NADPH] flavoprotein alpha-component n=1 Tax=Glaciecola petra TaxID=3075602 RepID=A0ABU2ZV45_9ALTE|nr:assimilatory sulfite reductase (NADPH) flavoprotein subunit [Aestuariibacter sp. P117]MDT0596522.1 assimilatory sulfite reductase (NADPH) flavoprotein subunit [Aestuariibacter sp. P117]
MTKNNSNSPITPLDQAQLSRLSQAVSGLSKDQLIWASGFVAGVAAGANNQQQSQALTSTEQATLTILYGSQTGNAKHEATSFGEKLKTKGLAPKVISMSDYKPRKLKDETHLIIFVSTHGEGDAPDDAVELHEFVHSKKAPKLGNLKYAVVGLGDTSYEFFCQTAKDFDASLQKLGATSLAGRLDCDVDYADTISKWAEQMTASLVSDLTANAASNAETSAQNTSMPINTISNLYTKQNPLRANLGACLKITGRDSVKDIRHIEIMLEDSGLKYQVGDALGIYFKNDPEIVERILRVTQTKAEEEVSVKNEVMTLSQALTNKLELTLSYPGFVKAYQNASHDTALHELLVDKKALRKFLEERQIVDIIEQYPNVISAQTLVDALRPISPRLYSIASSQNEVEDEVHLTVAHVDYQAFGSRHQGGASGFLSTRLQEGEEVEIFIESNDNFRLPSDTNTPVIMIGPGTGIAPFRAFMQERDVTEATGKNWLFFGNPHFTQDFLYQVEWQAYLKSGLLNKISLAFSRDQAEKIYVQDKLLEQGEEVFEWLEQGAHLYICGDAMRMAKDVEQALLSIIQKYGNKDEKAAKQYLLEMRKAKRYQKDVY